MIVDYTVALLAHRHHGQEHQMQQVQTVSTLAILLEQLKAHQQKLFLTYKTQFFIQVPIT